MSASLAQRLETARRERFVGRTAECRLFRSLLNGSELPFALLYVFGPGGVGKTELLRRYAFLAGQAGVPVIHLDGRQIDPSPEAFLAALQSSLGIAPPQSPLAYLAAAGGRRALLVDTYELLIPLDGWLRDTFLPQLPNDIFAVLAGREPPATEWRADPGWQALVRILPLRNLAPEESATYLNKREVPAEQHNVVLEFTHGHPLALSLVADLFAQSPGARLKPTEAPDVIGVLVERFVARAPSPTHRSALEASALVRLITEPLLAQMLELGDAHELFNWLRGLSFMDPTPLGLFPHDLARDALKADLRWRNPDRYAQLHQRARLYYASRLEGGDPQTQRRVLLDYIYLHRDNPAVRPYFEWQESGNVYTSPYEPADREAVLAMIERHEGAASAQLAGAWLARQPEGASVFRDASQEVQGALLMVALEQASQEERESDPATRAAWAYLQRRPLREGERATYFRFWLARETYQAISAVQSRIFLNMVQHYLTTPGLAYTFLPCTDPEFWRGIFTYADLARLEGIDFEVAGRPYGVYGHDWRIVSPGAWLGLLAEREMAGGPLPPPTPAEPLLVLSEADFADAIRDALRHFHDTAALQANPLLRSRLVVDAAGGESSSEERAVALRKLLLEATQALQNAPRQAKFFRALNRTYFQPAATQEQAAELLDLPFSTYRRHLRAGITSVTERLWQRELGAF